MESEKVTADAVEVTGYPDMSRRYRISGVPKTVLSDSLEFVGALPEAVVLEQVKRVGMHPEPEPQPEPASASGAGASAETASGDTPSADEPSGETATAIA